MLEEIRRLQHLFHDHLSKIASLQELEALRLHFIGKKGHLADLMQQLRAKNKEEIPVLGKELNLFKEEVERKLVEKKQELEQVQEQKRIASEWIDVTAPVALAPRGREHPLVATLNRIASIFSSMGLAEVEAPEIELDDYNFTFLNFPKEHPARDMQDTFYLNDRWLLRTHTSNFQVRMMQKMAPPLSLFTRGRVYRNEEISHRSHQLFHQVDGLYIDRDVHFGELMAFLEEFYRRLFEKQVFVRLRKSYFPFTEPSCEVDISCIRCAQKGCSLCKHTGFLEVAGAGMVHPKVLQAGGIDSETYSGWAFGMGVDRLVLLLYNIPDIRMLWTSDMRFLGQF